MARKGKLAAAAPPADFGAADSAMIPGKYFARKENCFQLKASFRIFQFSPLFAAAEVEKRKATAGGCTSAAAIVVHSLIKRAGSFIPLHLKATGTVQFRR